MISFDDKDRQIVWNCLWLSGLNDTQITRVEEDLPDYIEFDHSIVLLIYEENEQRMFQVGVIHLWPGNFYEPPDQETVFDEDKATKSLFNAIIQIAQKIVEMKITNYA